MSSEKPTSNSMDARLQIAGRVCLVILFVYVFFSFYRGYSETLDGNDFEDIYFVAAKAAAERADWLYERVGPTRKRNFVYPPAAAVIFYPFSFFSYEIAALIFSILKTAALLALMRCAITWQDYPPPQAEHRYIMIAVAMLITLQPTLSDVITAQVNMFVAFLAIAGVYVNMKSQRWEWFGGILIAVAATIKGSPILLFAVPFLHRRYKSLAIGLAALFLLNFALPYAWFGQENANKFFNQLPKIVNKRMLDTAIARPPQISLPDVIFFTPALLMADPSRYEYDWEEMELIEVVQTTEGVVRQKGKLPAPFTPQTAQRLYLIIAVTMGLLFLSVRYWLRSKCDIPWTWDASILIVIMVLLLPVARRAQLVGLIFPVGFIIVSFYRLALRYGSWKAFLRQERLLTATAIFTWLFFWLSDKPSIQFPGLVMPFRIWIPLSLIGMLVILTLLPLIDCKKVPGDVLNTRNK